MADGKIHPPTESRIAEARRAGVVPRPVLLGSCSVLMVLAFHVSLFGGEIDAALRSLLRAPLLAFAEQRSSEALDLVRVSTWTLARHALLFSLAAWLTSALVSFVAQGPRFGLMQKTRQRFRDAPASRTVPVLLALAFSILFLSSLRDTLWIAPEDTAGWLQRWLGRAAAGMVLLAIIDVSFARAAWFRALYMTRREQRDELRDAYGSPEARAERDRMRREQGQGA